MPSASPVASRAWRGGLGPRRSDDASTPTGRARLSPRWTAAAAVAFTTALQDQVQQVFQEQCGKADTEGGPRPRRGRAAVLALILEDEQRAAKFFEKWSRYQPSRVVELVRSIFLSSRWAPAVRVVTDAEERRKAATARAKLLLERVRAHAGTSPAPAQLQQADVPASAAQVQEDWVGQIPRAGHILRKPPPEVSRVRRLIGMWQLERLGQLPQSAVVCVERAQARIQQWRGSRKARARAPPPLRLLRAIVHLGSTPTAIASPGDHFWLPALGRWASPDEMMTLFGVPQTASVRRLLAHGALTACQLVACIGRAVHTKVAERVLRRLVDTGAIRLEQGVTLAYASACSGIDLFAPALDVVFGPQAWAYRAASESNKKIADALAVAYEARGLARAAVAPDATSALPPSDTLDLWVFTPPCEPFSRANRTRSDVISAQAAHTLDTMLQFARGARPRAIVVENVDEVDAAAVITAALMSIHGYTWEVVALHASDSGPMARARRFWLGRRTHA